MLERNARLSAIIIILGSFFLNCTGDNDDGTEADPNNSWVNEESFVSSVTGSKELGDMNDAEEQTLCEEMLAYGGEVFAEETWCMLHALSGFGWPSDEGDDAGAREYCQTRYDECLEDGQFADPTGSCPTAPDGCSVTVDTLEQCLDGRVAALRDYFESLPDCDEVTQSDYVELSDSFSDSPPMQLSDECGAIEDECQGVFWSYGNAD